jgi:hypothetical protein
MPATFNLQIIALEREIKRMENLLVQVSMLTSTDPHIIVGHYGQRQCIDCNRFMLSRSTRTRC